MGQLLLDCTLHKGVLQNNSAFDVLGYEEYFFPVLEELQTVRKDGFPGTHHHSGQSGHPISEVQKNDVEVPTKGEQEKGQAPTENESWQGSSVSWQRVVDGQSQVGMAANILGAPGGNIAISWTGMAKRQCHTEQDTARAKKREANVNAASKVETPKGEKRQICFPPSDSWD